MRILTALTGVAVTLFVCAAQPVAASDPPLSAEATGTGSHSYVYGWSVSKRAAASTVQIPVGQSSELSYTVKASRTKLWDGFGVTLRGCAKNAGSEPVENVSIELQLQSAPSASGPFTDVDSAAGEFAVGTLAPGAQTCRDAFFGVAEGSYSRNRVTVSTTSGASATATSELVVLPAAATETWDAKASVADKLESCPVGFTCEPPSVTFPVSFPSTAKDPGMTADPYEETVTYTQRVTAPACGSAAGTLRNVATLTELDSGQNQGSDRSSSATVAVTTGAGVPCPQAMTGAPTDVGETTATANGTVDTHGHPTYAYFEYGPTSDYGSATPPVRLTGSPALAAVSSALGGLSPGRTYHYRLATFLGPGGEVRSHAADVTFTTASPPPPKPKTVTICFEKRTLQIRQSQLANYLRRGARPGVCKTPRPRHRHHRSLHVFP